MESASDVDETEAENEEGLIVSQNSQTRHSEVELVNSLQELINKVRAVHKAF